MHDDSVQRSLHRSDATGAVRLNYWQEETNGSRRASCCKLLLKRFDLMPSVKMEENDSIWPLG